MPFKKGEVGRLVPIVVVMLLEALAFVY